MGHVLDENILAVAVQTLRIESEALAQAASNIDLEFIKIVRLIAESSGKVVVTGLGKSGHVARKVAATLTSTGTPACFLHPTEALHGDLGILAPSDVLFCIAFGGETSEVIDVARYARRIGVPVIGMSGRKNSTLASLSNHLINAHVEREACPLNLAPTSSSTLCMALGDALALSLMEARGFTRENFAAYHPGGSLGRKLAMVSEHMRQYAAVDFLYSENSFADVLEKVALYNYGIAPVVNTERKLLGCVTDGDVRRALQAQGSKVFGTKVENFMSSRPKTIGIHALAIDAVRIMEENRITGLFVIESDQPVGIIRLHDLLAAKIV